MNLKDFPYKTSFSAEIKCLVSPETDKFLSIASLDNLKFLIPQAFIDAQGIDLLPICFNAAVVNRANKNDDSIDTQTAIQICRNFIHRPVDVEHKPLEICGHIINAGYTQFGTDKELSQDEVLNLTDPFNIALAAYIYGRNYDDLADAIEEAADPDSLKFATISASWELLFKNYKIVKGARNLSEATVIDDPDEAKKLEPLLRINKGTGKDKEGNFIYRLITGEVYAGGIGLTKAPAAQVKGIFVPGITDKKDEENDQNFAHIRIIEENNKKVEEIISKIENTDVNKNEHMKKLTNLDDIKSLTDETLKECNASNLNNVLESELAKISEQVVSQRKEKEDALANASVTAKELEKVKADLETLKSAQAAKEAATLFDIRMASFDEKFTLDDRDRQIIAKQIKDLDETAFITVASDLEVLLASKKKTAKADDDESDAAKKDKADKEAQAAKDKKDKEDKEKADKDKSDKDKTDKDKSMASDARTLLDGIKIIQASVIPNTSSASESYVEKYKNAFGKENIITKRK